MEQVLTWLVSNGWTLLVVIGVLCVLHLLKVALHPYGMAIFLDWFTGQYNAAMGSFKAELFRDLGELRRGSGDLTVLEIGLGPGANFAYYPEGTAVVGVEPNPNFDASVARGVAGCRTAGVRVERALAGRAEDMRGLVEDDSVDAVVSTLVLCTVDDVDAALSEVKRVLKPGGKFYYLEHVVAEPGSWLKLSQWLSHPLWCYIFGGCRLMRAPWLHVERAGFAQATFQKFMAPPLSFGPMRPHAMGVATK